jgi:hypothetical protein
MSALELVVEKAKRFPPPLQREVLRYVEYLETKMQDQDFDGLLLSYDLLAEDWLSAADEEAWKDL